MSASGAQTVRDVLVGYTAIPDEVRDYAADTAAGLLDDMKVCRGSACARCRGALMEGWRGNAGGRGSLTPHQGGRGLRCARVSVIRCAPRGLEWRFRLD